ncbi:MAG TPA: diguanylate cyclase [Candidatus Polarisedimenticolaceae bacterium]|nr:diguanylate cyclase [Candidatus Polarisedimenticolaceae bacterium]
MKNHLRESRGELGSFIVDDHATILGFDLGMELLTGWPAIEVVGRAKNHCGGIALDGEGPDRIPPGTSALYDGAVPVDCNLQSIQLKLRCRDGRLLETEAVSERLDGAVDRARVTILRVLSLSAVDGIRAGAELHDELTLLPNGEAFRATLDGDLLAAQRASRPLALVLADVDRLRRVNDRWGREAGDAVLHKLAGILRVKADDENRIFRIGEDEFAILLPGAGRGEARQQAAALRSTVERFRFLNDHDVRDESPITLSLGAASFPADADNATDLFERAAEALDEARSMGRNRVWCYLRRPRLPIEVPVFFDGAEASPVGYTRDLSPSGVFVMTATPIDIGMRCALSFPLPGLDGRVHVIGRIVRTVPPESATATDDERVPGMGIEFERFGGISDRRAIEAFLHQSRPQSSAIGSRPARLVARAARTGSAD